MYDLKNDPEEKQNLLFDKAYADKADELLNDLNNYNGKNGRPDCIAEKSANIVS